MFELVAWPRAEKSTFMSPKNDVGDLIEQVVGIGLVLDIEEELAVLDGKVQCLLLPSIGVDPKADGHIGVETHDRIVLQHPEIMDGLNLVLDVNSFIWSELCDETGAVRLPIDFSGL